MDGNDLPFTIAQLNFIGDNDRGRFSRFDTSSNNFNQNSSITEPRFLKCVPLARGSCCGYVSLRLTLMAIALVDITIGGAALGIGITAF